MKALAATVGVVLLCAGVAAQQNEVIKVFVVPLEIKSEFVDKATKTLSDGHKAMVRELSRKKNTLVLVESREEADVAVELLKIEEGDSGKSETRANVLGGGVTTKKKVEFTATGRLSVVGTDYTTEVTDTGPFEVVTAAGLGVEVDKWLKANRQQVLAKRK